MSDISWDDDNDNNTIESGRWRKKRHRHKKSIDGVLPIEEALNKSVTPVLNTSNTSEIISKIKETIDENTSEKEKEDVAEKHTKKTEDDEVVEEQKMAFEDETIPTRCATEEV